METRIERRGAGSKWLQIKQKPGLEWDAVVVAVESAMPQLKHEGQRAGKVMSWLMKP